MQDGINQYRLIDDGGSVDWHEQAPSAGSKHFRITDAITREAANYFFPPERPGKVSDSQTKSAAKAL